MKKISYTFEAVNHFLTKSASSAVTWSTVSPLGEFSGTIPSYGALMNCGELSFTSPIVIDTVA